MKPHSVFRLLQLVPEPLPTFRADVATLFGKYLPRHGVVCDIVGKAGEGALPDGAYASQARPAVQSSRMRQEWAFFKLCLRRVGTARKDQCHLIQVRDMVSIGLLSMLLARCKGIPFAYWVSFLMSEGRIARARAEIAAGGGRRYHVVLLKGLIERFLLYKVVLKGANHVFVQSEAMKALMVEGGIPAEKLTAVPMGVDMEILHADAIAPRRLAGWEDVPVLAYLGTLDRSRELGMLLEALQVLRRNHPSARLLLIGASPTAADVPALLAHACRLGLADAVHVTGWLPSLQALSLLRGADVALSYVPRGVLFDYSSPTKLLEYLALGMPSVGNDSPDQENVLCTSAAGWLSLSNADAMAAQMGAILADLPAARLRAASGPAYIDATRSYRVLAQHLSFTYKETIAKNS
ncbi:glycosyltransferase [Janthinobacterium sp. HLX7-2]|uniref:glycosyltransferase n=1 Tax=Janthinobacterium sp. HLX7-2 TaxID=1259331 RepID=UPI003F29809C